ncbi:transcriptional regulator family: Fungal Specific TF [Aspergillus niger]|nr:transcriptional regulator family: Fungal Specific TF [Aspergillus niger]KAI3034013.1 transcriptional regulator family: Fungal Specific TF [Aspergillus niger]KAI3087666.1 transcriptional regulator family: Fungal Specific TF [Aspergillus niger]
MSAFPAGSFRNMSPAIDSTSQRQPDRPANPSVPASHPYQLPPPRTSAPLPFGTAPFLHQRNQAEGRELEETSLGRSRIPGQQQTANEQLPPVSQLLTPTAHPSRPSSPYQPHRFGIYTPPNGSTASPTPFRQSDPIPRPSLHESPRAYPEALPHSHTRSLPPLAHLSTPGLAREGPLHPVHTGSPVQSSQAASYPYYGFNSPEKEYTRDFSPSETPDSAATNNPSQTANVRSHVVDERYVEGEGLCYIYADGSHCPKIIDGVPVNANWGITKAGKPRKRLAQACLTCREKKIKCQPNLPKCDQCQKSGRECRFESAPRGHRAALKATQLANRYEPRESLPPGSYAYGAASQSPYSAIRASESSASLPNTSSQSPRSEVSMLTPSAMEGPQDSVMDHEQYRLRMSGHGRLSIGAEDSARRLADDISLGSHDYSDILMEMKDLDPQDPLVSDWHTDPYEADPEAAVHYVESYFTHVNDRLYYMFPRKRFLLWLRSCNTKTSEDTMLLYSMMTLGAVFSDRPDKVTALKRYSRTARYAVEHSRHALTLQLAQSRIIIGLWYYAIGSLVPAWDAIGSAVRTVCGLRYNVESGGVIVDQSRPCEYGLHPQALIECRRRTFWVAYLMDRMTCFYTPSSTFISAQAAYLRLPCREEVYEAQEYTTVPYFQSFLNQVPESPDKDSASLSAMALQVEILSLWGDVSDHVFRLSLVPAEAYNQLFEEFHVKVAGRADGWVVRLPDHLTYSAVNMERSIRTKKADAFMSIHLLYHATLMALNRYARYQIIRAEIIERHIRTTRTHAVEILQISLALMRCAADYEPSRIVLEPGTARGTILNPFLGYVIVSATDVLSAAGLMADLPESVNLIRGGMEAVRELARFWSGATPLATLIEKRLEAMNECLQQQAGSDRKAAFFVHGPSLDSQVRAGVQQQQPDLATNEDLMYGGLPREQLFSALGAGEVPFSDETILWIRERS